MFEGFFELVAGAVSPHAHHHATDAGELGNFQNLHLFEVEQGDDDTVDRAQGIEQLGEQGSPSAGDGGIHYRIAESGAAGGFLRIIEIRPRPFRAAFAVTQGIESGRFRADADPTIVTFSIADVVLSAYRYLKPMGRMSTEEVVVQLTALILEGLDAG